MARLPVGRFLLLFFALQAAFFGRNAGAIGLKTSTGEILIEGVVPGQLWLLPAKTPNSFLVLNNENDEIIVEMSIETGGGENFPNASLVQLFPQSQTIRPAAEVSSDIYVHLPADRDLLGKKFRAYLTARSRAARSDMPVKIISAVKVPLLIHCADQMLPAKFEFSRPEVALSVKAGQKAKLNRLLREHLYLANKTAHGISLYLRFLAPMDFDVPEESAADWTNLKTNHALLKPDQKILVKTDLTIPTEARPGRYRAILEARLTGINAVAAAHIPFYVEIQ